MHTNYLSEHRNTEISLNPMRMKTEHPKVNVKESGIRLSINYKF